MSIAPLWAAFSFLTRLTPARAFSRAEMAASPRWFPVVGLALGALATTPVALVLAVSSRLSTGGSTTPAHPALLALLYASFLFWATRGLHWDGLADCLDAWGSGRRGKAFQTILKDSRIGAFGVMGIVLTLAAMLIGLTDLIVGAGAGENAIRVMTALLLTPALGRTAMLILPALLPPHPVSTLGRLVAPGCTPAIAVCWCAPLLALWARLQGLPALALLLLLAGVCLTALYRLARRENGFNGDFLGCACLLTETAAILSALCRG